MPSVFVCPSTPDGGSQAPPLPTGVTSLAAIQAQTSDYIVPNAYTQHIYNGTRFYNNTMFMRGRLVPFKDVTDGLSNTIMMFESSGRFGYWYRNLKLSYLPPDNNGGFYSMHGWTFNRHNGSFSSHDFDFNAAGVPTQTAGVGGVINVSNVGAGFSAGNAYPFSFHAGGMNSVFGDGSVRFVNEYVSNRILEAIHTMDGGEVVGEF